MEKEKNILREILEWGLCIIIAILLALLIRYYVEIPTVVQQPSMYPTLLQGERLILNKWNRTVNGEIKRGDIITFESPSETFIPVYDADIQNPIAIYNQEPEGLFNKFTYYVLEINKKSFIKRVIGVEGDHVKIADGKVYINGKELEESYLQDGVITTALDGAFTELIVPKGTVFVMGDNREHSTDSRRFGCIPLEKVESKVLIRFWPLDRFGKVE